MISKKKALKKKFWFTDSEIETYQRFYDCDLSEIKGRFLSDGVFTGMRPYLDELIWHPIIHNKWLTASYYRQNEIEMAETLGYLHQTDGHTLKGEKLCSAEDLYRLIIDLDLKKCVIKHVGGGVGKHVYVIDEIEESGNEMILHTVAGSSLNKRDIDGILSEKEGGLSGYLVEKKLDLHPDILDITGGGLSSVRLETLTHGEAVHKIQYAYIRLGLKGRATDHFSNGGLYVPVDLKTGIMGKGLDSSRPIEDQWTSNHPSTNVKFEGKLVPHWDSIISLTMKVSKISPGLRKVGWDIVPSTEGGRLLEGNVGGSMVLDQLLCGGFIENGVLDEWVDTLSIPRPDGSLRWRFEHWNKGRRLKPFEQFISSFLPK